MEEQAPFGKSDYELPSYLEKVQSQLPALQLLMQLGWQYVTPEEAVNLRGGRLGSSILWGMDLASEKGQFPISHRIWNT